MIETVDKPAAASALHTSTYATLLVHAQPGAAASHRVECAARLARQFGARLIGVGAETFIPNATIDPMMGYADGEFASLLQDQTAADLRAAEAAFHRDAAGADVEWRAIQDYPDHALVSLSYAADLIVASPRGPLGTALAADPADVVMSAGRPVLLVPEARNHLRGTAVVVAWKNTRESRRAIADALPFLQRADNVVVQAVCGHDDEIDTASAQTGAVAANLKRHGVEAHPLVTIARTSEGVVKELHRVAALNDADLVVAGAYGHSRLREWAFGGVTAAFMHQPELFVLFSH